jgi:hypothetical protein
MSKHSLAHEYLQWTKQQLDEIDTTLAALEGTVEQLKVDARAKADRALARIRSARDAFKARVQALRSDASSAKSIADDAYLAVEPEWTEVELAFQDFLAAASGQAGVVKQALADRAEAQRQSWQSSLRAIRADASAAIDQARTEGDAAIRRLATEADKAKAKLGKVPAAGDESWKAIKQGLDEVISVYDRTWKKVSEAVAKIQ